MPVERPIAATTLTREDLARLEIGRTSITPSVARALIAVFLLSISIPPAIDLIVSRRSDGGPSTAWSQLAAIPSEARARFTAEPAENARGQDSLRPLRLLSSVWSRIVSANRAVLTGLHAFEDSLSDESPLAMKLRPPGQRVLSGWLGVGNERVYQGRDGWLFYRPDVDYVIGSGFLDSAVMRRRQEASREWVEQPHTDPRPAIVAFKRQLEQRGITLVVMPTPGKPAMQPDKLADGSRWTIPVQNPSYRIFVDDLRRANVAVFDVGDELARSGPQSRLYLTTDTHWRPETMERAAELLGRFIDSTGALKASSDAVERSGAPALRIEPREVTSVGDTAVMLDLPSTHRLNRPESVTIRRVLDSDGEPWRPSRAGDVLVLGDSFSNIYSLASMGWGDAAGFVEHLGRVLGRPVDRIVQNDNGAFATRERLRQEIASGTDRLRGKKIVVLQFAARELAAGDWKPIDLPPANPQ